MNKNPINPWAVLPGLGLGAIVGAALPYFWGLLKKGEASMNEIEKAYARLLALVLEQLQKLDAENEKLRKRPTREDYDSRLDEVSSLRLERDKLRTECSELRASRDQMAARINEIARGKKRR